MTLQLSVSAQDARLDSFESAVGVSPLLRIYTGAKPASCASPATGTMLVEATLPVDWMNPASGGTKTKKGTWEDIEAAASGLAGYFRIYESTGTTPHIQGTCSATDDGGDMTIDDPNIVLGRDVIVTTFTLIDGNG